MPYNAGQSGAPTNGGAKGRYAPDARRSAAFAMMADKNPWFESKLTRGLQTIGNNLDRIGNLGGPVAIPDFSKIDRPYVVGANAYPHGREGQNVTYADGHNSWETRSDVGVKNDNIYTRWSTTTVDSLGSYNRRGEQPVAGLASTSFAPLSPDDSALVNDGPVIP